VRQGTRGKAYNCGFAYGVLSGGRNSTNVFSLGKNDRGASICGKRETDQCRRGDTASQKSITGLEEEQSVQLSKLFAVNHHTWKAMKINNVPFLWKTL